LRRPASARRDRLRRERAAAQLRRRGALDAEVAEQLEPRLGPAGGPVGATAAAGWRPPRSGPSRSSGCGSSRARSALVRISSADGFARGGDTAVPLSVPPGCAAR
jgi:hypothetical protein